MGKITADKILKDINECIVESAQTYPRRYLGMSGIGDNCPRKIWYQWRWCYVEKFSPRLLRLFDRGHREEERFVNWLRAAGFNTSDVDPDTGRQYEFVACDGYVMGHSDGLVHLSKKLKAVGEFKTSNNKGFVAMKRAKSVKVSKYQHYCQMQRYMHEQEIPLALYMMVNKDNDDLYVELVEYDSETVSFLLEREKELVATKTPPARITEDETFWQCSYCTFKSNCFHNEKALKTCRMCQSIRLPGKGKWVCKRDDTATPLTLNEQLDGCKKFKEIEAR